MKLAIREDNTIVYLDSPFGAYHVVPKSIDPYNQFDYDELWQHAQAHPEDVYPEVELPTLEEVQQQSLQQVEGLLSVILEKGFIYGQDRIQADPVAQQNATGFLTAINAGVLVPFPIEWRTKANATVYIDDLDEFRILASMMLGFVQQVFHDVWQTKDGIRASTTLTEVDALMVAFRGRHGI
jgi:hypothetical protein